ncbi:uncharacterized protein STEHIDRAFT_135162 [Stereum hirsutum FP-91666 SS1]|uniref:uncharacterized protein n=1 Tax=Stereum hirsutum (strain FP-91666) TaxID=721885 RepID=UPI00044499A5|nr:uncharacterized protein STEHIDRAFT_135162 [Stereum hirsutum FP-91666 SS1]EIM80837.1 hypothetical protein STEHIDRAFT_135162 [Stereum hirsutum FP-91666 SS1]
MASNVFFVPATSTHRVLDQLFAKYPTELGKIGKYEQCAFITRGTGQFMPGPEARPAIGDLGKLEFVEEDRVEVVVNDQGGANFQLKGILKELKEVHPYEEVAYDVYTLAPF